MKALKKLWGYLSNRRQRQFWLLLILMVCASLTEIISLGAVLPFLGVLTAPEQLYQHILMQPLIQSFDISSPDQLLLPLTVVFVLATLFAGVVRLALLYIMTRFTFATASDLSIDIYKKTLYQEYAVHVARNSSEVINGIITKTNTVIGSILRPVLSLINSVILIIAILVALFTIDATIALSAATGFGLMYWVVIRYTREQLRENSQCIADQSTQMVKSLQEGLGGIRDVLIDGSQQFYCQLYRSADLPLRRASGNNTFIGGSPRYIMEALGMVLIAGLAYTMSLQKDGLITTIPVLGALALGAQRLLPALQQGYGAFSSIKGAHSSFKDVLDLLDQPLLSDAYQQDYSLITFKKQITFTNLKFRYTEKTPWVINNINLTIAKGKRIGFVGETGSGKSTLLDIVMGLLIPTSGTLMIDNKTITVENRRSWQNHIAHVPQNIYLADSTIEENVAFGISKEQINHQRVVESIKQAQLFDLVEEWPDKYQTIVGEDGVRLSGGQRQRIGIARALYKQADVLIFDEATSALDNDTELAVMNAIAGLGKELTILIIAHRVTTLKGCDELVKLSKNGSLTKGVYEEIVN